MDATRLYIEGTYEMQERFEKFFIRCAKINNMEYYHINCTFFKRPEFSFT